MTVHRDAIRSDLQVFNIIIIHNHVLYTKFHIYVDYWLLITDSLQFYMRKSAKLKKAIISNKETLELLSQET